MSLAELTRNSFQSGIPARKWLQLCKLLISREPSHHDAVEIDLSNSVLVLFRSYPGDPDLQAYLKHAVQEEMLSLPVFVSTMLQAVRSPELHSPATLDILCRIALNAHYKTGLPPVGSIVRFAESPVIVLGIIQDGLALLRTTHSLSLSHAHQLMESASELVVHLLSCLPHSSLVPSAQAAVLYTEASELLQNFRLASEQIRHSLDGFVLSLSLIIGDDAKAVEEAQLMHNMHMTFEKTETHGHGSDADVVSLGLLLHHMVSHRGHNFGPGNGHDPVALLVGFYRWSGWTPVMFYTQLFLSAFTCLTQNVEHPFLWKAFILGRFPSLLISFEQLSSSDNSTASDWRLVTRSALASILQHTDLIMNCSRILTESSPPSDGELSASFSSEFLRQLVANELVDPGIAAHLDSNITKSTPPRIQSEAHDYGFSLEAYLESKVAPEVDISDFQIWRNRICQDVSCHHAFSELVLKRFSVLPGTTYTESISHLCKILYTYDTLLDILALHIKISHLVFYGICFLQDFDYDIVGDPQTAVSQLGEVFLFLQYTIVRFHLEFDVFTVGNRKVTSRFLRSTDIVHLGEHLNEQESAAFSGWFKALFDSNSEGIEDTILRSTRPEMLLRISATLISQALRLNATGKLGDDVLANGVSYFTGPLLSWTLVGVVKSLITEIEQTNFAAPNRLEVLKTLLVQACPRPVYSLCSPRILCLLASQRAQKPLTEAGIDLMALTRVVHEAARREYGSRAQGQHDSALQEVRDALALARAGKPPRLDVERCLKMASPTVFLTQLWTELSVTASLGEIEVCRRIATFILTTPRCRNTAPLLPIFLYLTLPTLLTLIEKQPPAQQTVSVDLLAATITSALSAALHLEWASHMQGNDRQVLLGQSSTSMARRVVHDLRTRHNHAVKSLLQRMASSQSFVANFPVFLGDIGS